MFSRYAMSRKKKRGGETSAADRFAGWSESGVAPSGASAPTAGRLPKTAKPVLYTGWGHVTLIARPRSSADRAGVSQTQGRRFESCRGRFFQGFAGEIAQFYGTPTGFLT